MYPFLRFALLVLTERRKPRIGVFDTHVLPMRCLPNDLDGFLEMNNGRILTLYDLGRFAMSVRMGLWQVLQRERWGLVVAGSSVRYRARITGLQRFELRTRLVGWDQRFIYIEQAMWRGETCCNHALLRTGVTEKGRLAPTERVAEALGHQGASPALPDWVAAWTEADATRPWPPMQSGASSP
jgi:acyl-CoA thioesterase FadM